MNGYGLVLVFVRLLLCFSRFTAMHMSLIRADCLYNCLSYLIYTWIFLCFFSLQKIEFLFFFLFLLTFHPERQRDAHINTCVSTEETVATETIVYKQFLYQLLLLLPLLRLLLMITAECQWAITQNKRPERVYNRKLYDEITIIN